MPDTADASADRNLSEAGQAPWCWSTALSNMHHRLNGDWLQLAHVCWHASGNNQTVTDMQSPHEVERVLRRQLLREGNCRACEAAFSWAAFSSVDAPSGAFAISPAASCIMHRQ